MDRKHHIILADRGLVSVSGPESRTFLQGLISNDIEKVTSDRAIYATLLTPQGKFLHDFFVVEIDGALVFDCEGARRDDLERRFAFYRLRAPVTIEARDDHLVAALIGDGALTALGLEAAEGHARAFAGGIVYTDPRLKLAGARAMLPRAGGGRALEAAGFAPAPAEAYDRHRLALGLPDGSRDLPVEKAFLLENGIDALNGVDFAKGCYVGQELTARIKHRGTIRKGLFRVDVDGPFPEPGTDILLGEKKIGVMRSGRDRTGLALLRLERVAEAAANGEPLRAGNARLTPIKPHWAPWN